MEQLHTYEKVIKSKPYKRLPTIFLLKKDQNSF